MKRIAIALLFAAATLAGAQSTDNTLYVKQFPGLDVGTKVAGAQRACNPDTAIPCIIVIDPSLAKWAPGTMPALCAQCSLIDYRNGGNAFGNVTAPGVFTNTNTNATFGSLLNGCNLQTESPITQGGNNATISTYGCVNVPATASSWNNFGVAGYAVNNSPSAGVNAVGIYGQSRALVTGAQVWGGNVLVADIPGVSATSMDGIEVDVNVNGSPAGVRAIQIAGAGSGTMPGNSYGIVLGGPAGGFTFGVVTTDGGVSTYSYVSGAIATAANSLSQAQVFRSYNASGTLVTTTIQADQNGSINYASTGTGQSFIAPNLQGTFSVHGGNVYANGNMAGSASNVPGNGATNGISGLGWNFGGAGSAVWFNGYIGGGWCFAANAAGGYTCPLSIASTGDVSNAHGILLPSSFTGNTGNSTGKVPGVFTCTTGSITPATTAGGTASGTCTVTGSATGHPGVAGATDGSVQGILIPQVSVSGTTATVTLTTIIAGSPIAKAYNVTVF